MTEKLSDDAFAELVAPLRGELRAHCYRMLGSVHDADDALQEALLRAWRGFDGYAGRGSLRAWLYTVATRCSLDVIAARGRRALPADLGPASAYAVLDQGPATEIAWLTAYPDTELAAERRETVELAFVAALQHLPGNQRAVLLLFEVLGFSAAEIAEMMATSTTAVNSALARARRVLAEKSPEISRQRALRTLTDTGVRALVTAFADAFERRDTDALVALLTEDVTWSMPPLTAWYAGRAAVADFAARMPFTLCPSWRWRPAGANGQPAIAFYVGESPEAEHTAFALTVLTVRGDRVSAITSFLGDEFTGPFGFPKSV
ncbi:RNA polymerase subunit sigma-70 [Hamadaea tsunoensis]|uniref:RNA polymerase subunit sigma-70 n=1 Tax=Hamadaea tsunoensis TaxID=53368 RepID=UPI0003F52969|nr:RNA polymerase subunit sigma-70 [Hamadaea tsunoensis]